MMTSTISSAVWQISASKKQFHWPSVILLGQRLSTSEYRDRDDVAILWSHTILSPGSAALAEIEDDDR